MSPRCLVTGCGGFIGSHLAERLLDDGLEVYGTVRRSTGLIGHLRGKLTILTCDVQDRKQVESVVTETRPEIIFHLAAQSLVILSRQDPERTFSINVLGTLHLLEAVRQARIGPVVVVVGSSAEYGFTLPAELPISETRELRPTSPYGVSKAAEGMLAYSYWKTYGMKIVRARPFFVIGPGKQSDACSDFARGIVEIERGQRDHLDVGNLEPVRDFVDVQDAVDALRLLADKGAAGEVYNIASGRGYAVREVLDRLIRLSSRPVDVRRDPALMRPADDPVIIGDNTRLTALGWRPQIGLDRTLADILEYWRRRSSTG